MLYMTTHTSVNCPFGVRVLMVFSILGVSGNSETRHIINLSNFSYKWTSLTLLHAARDGKFFEKWTWVSGFPAFEVFRRFFLFLAGFSGFENSKNQMDGFLMQLGRFLRILLFHAA